MNLKLVVNQQLITYSTLIQHLCPVNLFRLERIAFGHPHILSNIP